MQQTQTKQLEILIIDDDTNTGETLADVLDDKGYSVTATSDGQTGLQLMRENRFDLILVDIMLPGMNGVETLRQIRRIAPDAATVLMTGHSQLEGYVSDALWSGADGVLYKPFEMSAVLEMIEQKQQARSGLQMADLRQYQPDPAAIEMVPQEMARKYTLLPLSIESGHLLVAMADPTNLYAIEDLRVRTSLRIRPLKAHRAEIEEAIERHFGSGIEIEQQIHRITASQKHPEADDEERVSAEMVAHTPVVRAVELMLHQAVKDRASDIHLEPQEDHLRVRYRIDGVLHDAMRLPKRVHAPLISRIKVLANLNIAERRRPQDGQFSIKADGRDIDFRVATINTVQGEMAVLRVLDKLMLRELDQVGFMPGMLEQWMKLIHSPWGIVLIAGPTGSGKTSTMYASINQLDKDEDKIITIEDPVEYRFDAISQVQVNRQAGITFASGLRSAMRLDPDTILVGEIRDNETAATAIQASLTGHLVLSSIHANDTVGAVFRLIDLGIEPFLVTSSLIGVLSQRLLRRVCTSCGQRREATYQEQTIYEQTMDEARKEFVYGVGCNECAQTGYRGRVPAFELLTIDDNQRRMILEGANSQSLREAADKSGLITMVHDAMLKVQADITNPSEVMKEVLGLKV
jgi:type II secretory ATPase GspE/PulE/Tfp pilus assembly ATPase PilB-like protein/AmiR/NasT family two-component response regulator